MDVTFQEDVKQHKNLKNAGTLLKTTRVEIGLPSSASSRNRWLLALHERGAPGAHIPPRPVVGPALAGTETRRKIQEGLLAACEAASGGDSEGVLSGFSRAGQAGVDGIRACIDAGIPPPNASLTIRGGWIRNFSSKKPVHVEGKGFDKPLYDTGELYNSFDFEVKSK